MEKDDFVRDDLESHPTHNEYEITNHPITRKGVDGITIGALVDVASGTIYEGRSVIKENPKLESKQIESGIIVSLPFGVSFREAVGGARKNTTFLPHEDGIRKERARLAGVELKKGMFKDSCALGSIIISDNQFVATIIHEIHFGTYSLDPTAPP